MNIGTKKGLGIITCQRPEFYQQILDTTPFDEVDQVYVFDSSPPDEKYVEENDKIILVPHDGPATVGFGKNRLWEKMMEDGVDHLYLQEGDVGITDPNVFDLYLETAKHSGCWGSLAHAWHGKANKDVAGIPQPKNSIMYDGNVGIDFVHNGAAAFTYHHTNVLNHVGLIDEAYHNAWEHLDHYQSVAKAKLGPYWWWFPDAKDSFNYIQDLDDGNLSGSVIRKDENWENNMRDGIDHFRSKFGFNPLKMPMATEREVLDRMNFLADKYAKQS